jgi:ppGpp synthetase/RelA/SpoT-type nucleotidyltranferase
MDGVTFTNPITDLVKEYRIKCSHYLSFTKKLEHLLKELLQEKGISVVSVTSRVKPESSFKRKIVDGKYSRLEDVTDISGVRIVTFFADDVDTIAKIVKAEFVVDPTRSVDKRELLDADRFGYLSLHYIVKLSADRLKLTEYSQFSDCTAEIQIRSVLQHAWAEIEHDLGYKSKQAVPKEIRRRFSRVAGLLEVADTEFIQIRRDLHKYEKNVPQQISKTPEAVSIDKASLTAFIRTNPTVMKLDSTIASLMKAKLDDAHVDESDLQRLEYFGMKTIGDIDCLLRENEELITEFSKRWVDEQFENVDRGISIFYFIYILAARKGSKSEIIRYLDTFNIGSVNETTADIAEDIQKIYDEISGK